MGVGTILRWRWHRQNQDSRRLGFTSQGSKIRSRNILQFKQFWTSVNGLFGGRKRECLGGGGSRKAWTCRGRRIEHRRSRMKRRRNMRREQHSKKRMAGNEGRAY